MSPTRFDQNPFTVLVVDDSNAVLKACLHSFRADEWHVLIAKSGEQAVHILDSEHADVVVLDLELPGIDGMETLRRLRTKPTTASLPVIFHTSNSSMLPDQHELNALGVYGVIDKSGPVGELPQLVHSLILGTNPSTSDESPSVAHDLTSIWNSFKGDAIDSLKQLHSIVCNGDLQTRQHDAKSLVHELIGVFGVLGLTRACHLLRQIEARLTHTAFHENSEEPSLVELVDDLSRCVLDYAAV
jgi:CheY-like chemotaxis protein